MLSQSYSTSLVVLSIVIATMASYTALDLAGRVYVTDGRARALWLAGGALAMGVGIWSMNFVGMLALQLSVHVAYSLPYLIASIGVAIGASCFALFIAARATVGKGTLVAAAVAMGMAIAGMHYVGMAGMQMSAAIHYDRRLYGASIVIAITASYVALYIARRLRGSETRRGRLPVPEPPW